MSARWWSQPFAPEGSAAAEGIAKQLGRPSLDPLTVLVREAAQNSWDARAPDGLVDFSVDIRTLRNNTAAWRAALLPQPSAESHLDIDQQLNANCVIIVVSDRNTIGLGGPLRAGERPPDDVKSDFVQFLRNVGEPSDHQFGGGTYGFGKGIFYQLSHVGAILVDTNVREGGPTGRRLMGAALGHSWYQGDRRFTGRHWWGNVSADDVPDPVLSHEAEFLATSLGLPGFADGRSGTDIVIIAADLGVAGSEVDAQERTPHEAATFIASSVLWNLWPKMVSDEQGHYMRFTVGVDGSSVAVVDPQEVVELEPFVEALLEIRAGRGLPYSRTVPPRHAGTFALAIGAASRSERLAIRAARPFEGSAHHVARMRVAELVVDYLAGPPHPDTRLAYGAVYKASEDADALFAASEPPTHDDWVAKGLTGPARGTVLGARTFIQKQLDERLGLAPQAGGSGGQGLGQLSMLLASIIPARFNNLAKQNETDDDEFTTWPQGRGDGGEAGTGTGSTNAGSGFGTNGSHRGGGLPLRRGGKPKLVGTPALRLEHGEPYLVAAVRIPASDFERTLAADVEVVIEGGGREVERPLGAIVPRVIEWRSNSGEVLRGRTLHLAACDESDWCVYATHVPDAVVRFSVTEVKLNAA
jgi:hypothetical protein